MAYIENFSTDPSQNVKTPPNGAPQGGLPLRRVSATFRVVMAAAAECWTAIKALKGMAYQDPANVNITGGRMENVTIAGLASTAEDADKLFGMGPQQLYDAIWPVGECRMMLTDRQPTIWAGVAATWQYQEAGRYLRTSTPAQAGQTGGNSTVNTSAYGGHNHGGVTGSTAINAAGLPNTRFVTGNLYTTSDPADMDPAGGNWIKKGAPGDDGLHIERTQGGGAGHNHTIASAPDHYHEVQLTPVYENVTIWKRIS